jgi:putative SOS response-associated peptidase YedK
VFAFAGLWEVWRPASGAPPLRTCTIVTTAANVRLSALHDRMPVVLPASAWSTWLDPTVDDRHGELSALLVAAPDDTVDLRDVSRAVNDVRNNGPELLDAPV